MKKTAVEWLIEQLFGDNEIIGCSDELLNQAKEMEKEQIGQAYVFGTAYGIDIENGLGPLNYYNETYNQ